MLSVKLRATLPGGACHPQPLHREDSTLQNTDSWAQLLAVLLWCILIPAARSHTYPPQAAPRTQPVLSHWKPARAHSTFISSHTRPVTTRCGDFTLQASTGQRMPVSTAEPAGTRSVFSLAGAGTARGLPVTNPSLPSEPTEHAACHGTVCRATGHIGEPTGHPKGKIHHVREVCVFRQG